jgi:uncharacterized repeat protein (TIGR01451 family)
VTGPETAMVGAPLDFQIVLRNTGTAPINSVILTDDFDVGLEHESHSNPIKKTVGPFAPGEATTVKVTLTPSKVGKLANRVSAVADGGLNAKGEHIVDVRQAAMKVDITGPERKYVNKPVTWQIKVSNPGEMPLNNIVVRDLLPAELGFVSATAGGAARGPGEIVWTLSTLPPSQTQILELTTNALRTSAKVMNSVQAVADGGVAASGQAGVEINGLPAFRIDVQDRNDPIEVGQSTSYDITIINRGTMAGSDIAITATVPPELKVVNVRGPTQPKVEGGKITFPPLATLPVGQKIVYGVDVQALKAGRAVFQVELRTPLMKEPVIQQESTTIIGSEEAKPPSGVTPASTAEPPR